MACLDVKKRRGSRVEGGRVIQLPHLEVFLGRSERDLEGFGGVSITSNSLFLIPQIGEILRENRVDKLLTK